MQRRISGDYNLYRYCHNDPVNKTDSTGLADVSYVPSWDTNNSFDTNVIREVVRLFESKQIIVAAHGLPGYAMNSNTTQEAFHAASLTSSLPKSMQLGATQIAKDVKAVEGYKPDAVVKLDICYAGRSGPNGELPLGQQVANILGTNKVIANTGPVSSMDGRAISSKSGKEVIFQKMKDELPKKEP